jgi:hypothetical protein
MIHDAGTIVCSEPQRTILSLPDGRQIELRADTDYLVFYDPEAFSMESVAALCRDESLTANITFIPCIGGEPVARVEELRKWLEKTEAK